MYTKCEPQCTSCTLGDYDVITWVINCNKCTTPVRAVDNGEGMKVWEKGVYGEALYFLLHFAVNLKLL